MSLNIEYRMNDKVVIVTSRPRDGRRSGGGYFPPSPPQTKRVAISPGGSTYTQQASGRELFFCSEPASLFFACVMTREGLNTRPPIARLSHMSICHGRALSRTQSYHMGWKKRRWKSLVPLVRGTYPQIRVSSLTECGQPCFTLNQLEHHEGKG